ncbi:universal stress protein [Streptomyces sp. NPDC055099]
MSRTVTVGIDGSPESRAAAEWAAREASLCGLPVKLVHVMDLAPEPVAQAPFVGAETRQYWGGRLPRESAEGLRLRHPGVEVISEQVAGRPEDVLLAEAKNAALLVLGSRGLGGIGGYLVGSVGQTVAAHTETPVVLVRAGEQAADEHTMDPVGVPSAASPYRPVVLGLDIERPHDSVIAFAFDAAVRRATALRVVHGWQIPPYYAYGLSADPEIAGELARQQASALSGTLVSWRKEFPAVEVVEESRLGAAAGHLVDASREASLVVVGRRMRGHVFGVHIGPVTHAVLHHSAAPVAVVAHG